MLYTTCAIQLTTCIMQRPPFHMQSLHLLHNTCVVHTCTYRVHSTLVQYTVFCRVHNSILCRIHPCTCKIQTSPVWVHPCLMHIQSPHLAHAQFTLASSQSLTEHQVEYALVPCIRIMHHAEFNWHFAASTLAFVQALKCKLHLIFVFFKTLQQFNSYCTLYSRVE